MLLAVLCPAKLAWRGAVVFVFAGPISANRNRNGYIRQGGLEAGCGSDKSLWVTDPQASPAIEVVTSTRSGRSLLWIAIASQVRLAQHDLYVGPITSGNK